MRFLAFIGALAIAVAIGAATFFFGGYFNIAASVEDPDIVNRALTRVREASIDHYAKDRPPAAFGAPDAARNGAAVFAKVGCVHCHGAPGVEWSKFSEGMNPDPPDLKKIVGRAAPEKLFWVVKNGIKMTGMPSFAALASDEQIWTVVAFLKKLPDVSDADFKAWSAAPAPAETKPGG